MHASHKSQAFHAFKNKVCIAFTTHKDEGNVSNILKWILKYIVVRKNTFLTEGTSILFLPNVFVNMYTIFKKQRRFYIPFFQYFILKLLTVNCF